MRITRLDVGGLDLTPPAGADGPRGTGVHVSDIIRDISNTVLKPGQREKYDDLSPEEQRRLGNYAAGGWAWEQIIREGLIKAGVHPNGGGKDRYIKPGQLRLDGIYGTPDWLDCQDYVNVEFKATWRSSGRPIDTDFWEWLVQFKCYCKMLTCRSTRLYVFWVNGDYKESGPQYEGFNLEWSKLEIDENWEMIRNHAKEMRRQSGV